MIKVHVPEILVGQKSNFVGLMSCTYLRFLVEFGKVMNFCKNSLGQLSKRFCTIATAQFKLHSVRRLPPRIKS